MKCPRTIDFFIAGSGLMLSMVLSAGCIGRGPQSAKMREPMPTDYPTRVNQYILKGWNFKLGETVGEIKRNLGRPLSMIEKQVENIHYPERMDKIYELRYQGLQVGIYKVTETNKEIITDLTIFTSRYPLKWGLTVGCSVDDVRTILGEPIDEDQGIVTYETGDEAPSSVSFFYRGGTVYKIGWVFYID